MRWWCSASSSCGGPASSRSGRRLFYAIGAYAVALIGRYTPMRDVFVVVIAGAACAANRRLFGRLPARALPRNLLRDAKPRDVDDPLRRAGEDRGARLHRRLPCRGRHVLRLSRRRAARSILRCSGSCSASAPSRPMLVSLYFRTDRGRACALPVRDNEIRAGIPRRLGQSPDPSRSSSSPASSPGSAARWPRFDRPCRPQYGVLDDLGRLRVRHHPGRHRFGRRRLRRLVRVRAGALDRGRFLAQYLADDRSASRCC